eukprot:20153-Rhodomonas_salina.1
MDTIIAAAQAIADHLQLQYDSLWIAVSPGSSKPKIKTQISEFDDAELKMMMGKASHGNIIKCITILKLGYFNGDFAQSQTKSFHMKLLVYYW